MPENINLIQFVFVTIIVQTMSQSESESLNVITSNNLS